MDTAIEIKKMIFYFWTVVAGLYGLLIGSFLNVCIFRLPPRVFIFDDLFFDLKSSSIFTDIKYWLQSLIPKRKIKIPEKLEPSLYAEAMVFMPLYPELVSVGALSGAFNLFKEVFPEEMTLSKPKRSFCPNCKNKIKWWMNIPVLSYIFLKGRCFYCKKTISLRYPINELISGVICGALFYFYGMEHFFVFLYYYILAAICIVVFYIDMDYWIILDEITLTFTIFGVLGSIFVPIKFFNPIGNIPGIEFLYPAKIPAFLTWINNLGNIGPKWLHLDSFFTSLFSATLAFSVFCIISVVGKILAKREAMGGGDLKLAMLMGAFLGYQKCALAVFIAVILGVVVMLPGVILGRKTGKDQVPFGCFLSFATILTLFFGDKIIKLYFNLPMMTGY